MSRAAEARPPSPRSLGGDVPPRPQLSRSEWFELDGDWGFAVDDGDEGIRAAWMRDSSPFSRTIRVPFPPESEASGIADRGVHPILWYRRVFTLPDAPGDRWLIHFGAVDQKAQVFVDGSLVCAHSGGHTPFLADITDALGDSAAHVVTVRAEDRPSLTQARGKQDWSSEPQEIWYDRTSGIWQPVWLERVPALHVTSVRWTPDVEHLRLGLDVSLNAAPTTRTRLHLLISGAQGTVADDIYSVTADTIHREIGIDVGAPSVRRRRDILWSPEYPNLLSVVISLELDGQVTDVIHSYAGLRSTSTRDGMFVLNGWPYYLRMVLAQGYWPESHLAAPDADALRREVQLIRQLGFNGVRVHQKIEDPRFLYWCDRLGLLVWEEMPSSYAFTPEAAGLMTREWLEVLQRDHSHPCVVTWVPFNESWGAEWLREDPRQRSAIQALTMLTDAVDGTRPVLSNDGWEFDGGDLIGIHDYTSDPETLRERYGTREQLEASLRHTQPNGHAILLPGSTRNGEPVVLSEFGGITFAPRSGEEWFGYGVVRDAEALLAAWRCVFAAVLESDALAGFCYTQLTDTRQETNGMATADRVCKVDPRQVREIVRAASRAIPAEDILNSVLNPADVEVPPGAEDGSAQVDADEAGTGYAGLDTTMADSFPASDPPAS